MNTHCDDDVEIPEVTDFSGFRRGRYARKPGEPLEIRVDGAVEYSLRLIPSNKVVGRFASTLDAWPAILAEAERGIPASCLVLDWHGAEGAHGPVGSGRVLVSTARSTIRPNADRGTVRAAS
jgi:hypothetical protein